MTNSRLPITPLRPRGESGELPLRGHERLCWHGRVPLRPLGTMYGLLRSAVRSSLPLPSGAATRRGLKKAPAAAAELPGARRGSGELPLSEGFAGVVGYHYDP